VKTKLLTGASVGAILLSGSAQAADLGVRPVYKAPPPAPVTWNWTGFYVGANIGAVFHRGSIADDPSSFVPWLNGASFDNDGTGVIGGLEAGYNWQMASLVLGIEADISASSLNHSNSNVAAPFGGGSPDVYSTKMSWLGTVRGRVGWAFDRVLVYGTGGVAFANLKDGNVDTWFPITASTSSGVTGWTAGGGIEYALVDHWTVKAEYLHVGFPNRTATDVNTGYAFRFKDSLDIGRVGINYKF
jgi:outer membrane immunogenic protein